MIGVILCFVLLESCDCYHTAVGTVVDTNTGKPLEEVKVVAQGLNGDMIITESDGMYSVSVASGPLCWLYKIRLTATKQGYAVCLQIGGGEIRMRKIIDKQN